jgi:hypothetical protein
MQITRAMLADQARVHNHQECCGLPYCASCRASVLLNTTDPHLLPTHTTILIAEHEISKYAKGTKVYLDE